VGNPGESVIVWTDYMKYRAELRGFELSKVEDNCGIQEKDTLIPQPSVLLQQANMMIVWL